MKNKRQFLAALALGLSAAGAADLGNGYARVWNAQLNAEIDARIEKCRKADFSADGFPAGGRIAFRGFRGGYRLSWKNAAGETATREVSVR